MSNPEVNENKHYDVGIVGLWYGLNYGSILTYYALYDVVKSMGLSAAMVNKPEVLWTPKYAEKDTIANKFIYKYCDNNVTPSYHSSLDYRKLNDDIDTFIVGSDVVWNYRISCRNSGQFFFLDFADDSKKKIAMACSFGDGYKSPDVEKTWSEQCMKKFDHIGVREDEAVRICKDVFGCSADKIMDPVFLCSRQVYHDIAANSKLQLPEKYTTSYFLGSTALKHGAFIRMSEKLGCKPVILPNPNLSEEETGISEKDLSLPSVEDWLKYFENTQCYVGDSFHGLCFALIFERPFVILAREIQGLPRFRTLLSAVGLENRLIHLDVEDNTPEYLDKRIAELLDQKIDYEKVRAILEEKSKQSRDWLKNAIGSEKKAPAGDKRIKTFRNDKMNGINPETVAGVPENVCTGCSACVNVCPADAVSMKENPDGFIMPCIDPEKCIRCGKCINTCPAVNVPADNTEAPIIYSAMANDEVRTSSSSGGMFTVFADKILEMGGYVCGAVFDSDNLEIRHIIADTTDGTEAMKKSKYAQSNIGTLYRDVKKLLNENKPVLFTGTPCQVAGLNSYLGRRYDNLFTVDILCHGVPSQKMLRTYIEEISARPEICTEGVPPKPVNIIFRDKMRHGWRSSTFIRIEFSNGRVYESSLKKDDPFEHVFHDKIALRLSCADCKFCAFPRQGDVSIGDFWGIQDIAPEMTDHLGTSIVFINNQNGRQFFDSINSRLLKKKKMDLKTSDIKKTRVFPIYPASPKRPRFMELLKHHTLTRSVELLTKNHFDVGLAVNFYAKNFGGALTHYALYHTLEDLGYSVLMIERPKTAKYLSGLIDQYKKIHIAPLYPDYAVAESYPDKTEMRRNLNSKCDTFVVGSDKLFNFYLYSELDKYTSLDWVSDDKKKIAYSASFGRTLGDPKIHRELAFYLQRFDSFSCREDSGVVTAKEVYGINNAEWVLDPVFLCDMKHYQALIGRCRRKTPERYVSAYILDPSEEKAMIVRYFKESLDADCETFSEYNLPASYYEPLGDLYKGPLKTEERLQSIANCEYFVTDSFHGMCFAILMRKPFAVIINEHRGAARFWSIAKMLHLEDRLISDSSDIDLELLAQPVDYDKVYEILDRERARCTDWLTKALDKPKVAAFSELDILREIIDEQEQKINNLMELVMSMAAGMDEESAPEDNSMTGYLSSLKNKTDGNIIVIAVKDTTGAALDPSVSEKLKALGLSTNLQGQHGHSYAAVINSGRVVFEQLGSGERPTVFNSDVGGCRLYVASRVYRNGNEAVIEIDGKNYSVNSRGLNIVIYNKAEKKLVDSVCFDTDASNA